MPRDQYPVATLEYQRSGFQQNEEGFVEGVYCEKRAETLRLAAGEIGGVAVTTVAVPGEVYTSSCGGQTKIREGERVVRIMYPGSRGDLLSGFWDMVRDIEATAQGTVIE